MNWKIVLLVVTVTNAISYCSIREILWSIVWLNRRGKQRKLIEYKKAVRDNESVVSRISMRYVLEHITVCKKDFSAWLKVKRFFSCMEGVVETAFLIAGIYWGHLCYFKWVSIVFLSQSLLALVIVRFQFGVGGHLTKYDRMRMK